MGIKPIKRNNISSQVFDQIRDQIVKGEWTPGTKIPSENEFSRILGVSRITIREVLKKLTTLGLLETRQGEGTYVRELSADNFMDSLLPLLVLDNPGTIQILEFRRVIEIETVGLAVDRANDDDIRNLECILAKMKQYEDDLKKFAVEDLKFHISIAEITKNPLIIKVISIIRDILKVSMQDIVGELGTKDGLYYHKKIIEAIKLKDRNMAKQLMEEHIIITIERLTENENNSIKHDSIQQIINQ